MNRTIFILVPALRPTGPVKGAVALANALAGRRRVVLVALKGGCGAETPLDNRVTVIDLSAAGGLRARRRLYREQLRRGGGRAGAAAISFCLSADMFNLLCRGDALICSSVRGNLPLNYRMDYGRLGLVAAAGHLFVLRWFDEIVAMTSAMADQVRRYAGRQPAVIGNFIDENALESHRANAADATRPWRFLFVGSLSERKQPQLVIDGAAALHACGHDVSVDFLGDGPLRPALERRIDQCGLSDRIVLHGHVAMPYGLLAEADALVMPSLSEGISRAVLEALHLGVPVALRAVDGNAEIVSDGVNGVLFRRPEELPDAMAACAALARRQRGPRPNLLPPNCRQASCAQAYLAVVERERHGT